jgi:hypothetical protein
VLKLSVGELADIPPFDTARLAAIWVKLGPPSSLNPRSPIPHISSPSTGRGERPAGRKEGVAPRAGVLRPREGRAGQARPHPHSCVAIEIDLTQRDRPHHARSSVQKVRVPSC